MADMMARFRYVTYLAMRYSVQSRFFYKIKTLLLLVFVYGRIQKLKVQSSKIIIYSYKYIRYINPSTYK